MSIFVKYLSFVTSSVCIFFYRMDVFIFNMCSQLLNHFIKDKADLKPVFKTVLKDYDYSLQ